VKSARSSSFFDISLLLVALGAGAISVAGLRLPLGRTSGGWWLWGLLLVAGVLGGLALARLEPAIPQLQPPARLAPPSTTGRRRAAMACLGVALLIVGAVVLRLWPDYRRWEGTFLPWVAALVLTVVGGRLLGTVGSPAPGPERQAFPPESGTVKWQIPRSVEIGAFLLIAAVAIFCRVYRLRSIPSGIYVDETNGAMDALLALEGQKISPFGTAWYETPAGFIYFMAGLFQVFGANYFSLKAVSVIPSILAVLAIYPLGRALFGPVAGLSAMALMAVSRWHLTMSRWGWNETAPLVFQILATYFLIRGLRDARALAFVSAGLLAGLCMYTYLSSRIVFATLVVFCVYWIAVDREGPIRSWRRHGRGLLLFFLAFLIAVAPLAVTYATQPFLFFNRMREISIFNEVRETHSYQPLVDNVVRHLKFFHQTGDLHAKHNLPGEPETDPITGVLFVVGLGYAAFRLRDRRRGLLWMWLIFAMLAGVLSVRHEAPQAYRTLGAVPAIALLAGDALARIGIASATVRRARPEEEVRWTGRAGLAIAVLLVGVLGAAVWEIRTYFGRQASSDDVRVSFNLPENYTAREVLAALDRPVEIYLSPRVYDYSPLRFLVYGAVKKKTGGNALANPPYHRIRPDVEFPLPPTGKDALLLLSSDYWPVRDYLTSFYPAARVELIRGPGNLPLYVRMRIPAATLHQLSGLAVGRPAKGGVERSGGVRVDKSGFYEMPADDDRTVSIDGEPWQGRRFLARGFHDLSVVDPDAGRADRPIRWKPPEGELAAIPEQSLFRVGRPRLGLLGAYFSNADWQGDPVFRQITPIMLLAWQDPDPFSGPFSARFTGALRVAVPGTYRFRIEADDGVRLTLDGRVLGEGLVPNHPNALQTQAELAAGDHPIQIDYFQNGGGSVLEFFWQPPDSEEAPVPPRALIPPETSAPSRR
jgi:4-amino-4-deoxy-L-arabinose transferase-like glycosyltransferase